jgi:predicted DNA-binding protein (MmcQ/YjbR family)
MPKTIPQAVREVCGGFAETVEVASHGMPDFRVRNKSFANFVVNHHGDGRVALWLKSQPEEAAAQVAADPENFFVPPYVGTRGWLGVRVDRSLSWNRIAALVHAAYDLVAPPDLRARAAKRAVRITPLQAPGPRRVVAALGKLCLALPETRAATQFGFPVWQVGKKTFANIRFETQRLYISVWAGGLQQSLLGREPRFHIPSYLGAQGWLAVDVQDGIDWDEIRGLVLASYRHYAPQRAQRLLDPKDSATAKSGS